MSIEPTDKVGSNPSDEDNSWASLWPVIIRLAACLLIATAAGFLVSWDVAAQVFIAAAGIAAITSIRGSGRSQP